MVQKIPTGRVNTMFPFDFYYELAEAAGDFTYIHPAFVQARKDDITDRETIRNLYDAYNAEHNIKANLPDENLLEFDPMGEVLMLHEPVATLGEIDQALNGEIQIDDIPLRPLIVQLYDSSGQPVLAQDVRLDTIRKIQEVLFDDPNLYIGALEQEPEGTFMIRHLKIPEKKLQEWESSFNQEG